MKSENVVEARSLSKRYQLGNHKLAQRTFRELFYRRGETHKFECRDFWALRDVSFDVKRGEVLGIVGHNGAGKTTLLRLLSRISPPTAGSVRLRGRVGTLLEVGTGFHSELTGRENIFLSGAILGMSRHEIRSHFDEIVAFAEVEAFLDTAVKHYSSGMYLRLAFAVAAHLQASLLLVDEVLAVGDAAFQRKCLGKMREVTGSGRTILFVSHQLSAIANLCQKAIWLSGGRLEAQGATADVLREYVASMQVATGTSLSTRTDRRGDGRLRFVGIKLKDAGDGLGGVAVLGGEVTFELEYVAATRVTSVIIALVIRDANATTLFTLSTHFVMREVIELQGSGMLRCHVPALPLVSGAYSVGIWSSAEGELCDEVMHALPLQVVDGDHFSTGKVARRELHGPFVVSHHWELKSPAELPPLTT